MNSIAPVAPEANVSDAIEFLKWLDPDGRHCLCAQRPDTKRMTGRTFPPGAWDEMAAWTAAHNADGMNIYFMPNEVRADAPNKRPEKSDIAIIRAVYIDVDPPPDLPFSVGHPIAMGVASSLQLAPCRPSVTVSTGGGIQSFWRLPEKILVTDETLAWAEAQGGAIRDLIGDSGTKADNVQAINHPMRLPGTVNYPKAVKRQRGQPVALAKVLHTNGSAFTREQLAGWVDPGRVRLRKGTSKADELAVMDELDMGAIMDADTFNALPPALLGKFMEATEESARLARLWRGDKTGIGDDDTGSGWRAALAANLALTGIEFSPQEYGALLWVWEHGIGAGKTKHESLTPREIARKWLECYQPNRRAEARPGDYFQDETAAGTPRVGAKGLLGLSVVTGLTDPTMIPVANCIVQPRYPVGDVTMIAGEPGVSKSTMNMRDALVVASGNEGLLRGADAAGNPISPERLHQSCPVLIYNAEDRLLDMERRRVAAMRHHGITDLKHPIILWSGLDNGPLVLLRREGERGPLKRSQVADDLERVILFYGVKLVFLDPQVSLCAGATENSNDDINALYQELANMAASLGVCIAVNAHTSKATRDAAGDMGASRGAFAGAGKARVMVTLTNDPAREGCIRLDYAKVSHGKKPTEPIVFRRVGAPVGNGSGVRPETAEALFTMDARQALVAVGDYAPVLDIVDVKVGEAAGDGTSSARAIRIAEIADALLGDEGEGALTALWPAIGGAMRAAGLTKATQRNTLSGDITAALLPGVRIERGGQNVLIRVEKRGRGEKAPWWIVRSQVQADEVAS